MSSYDARGTTTGGMITDWKISNDFVLQPILQNVLSTKVKKVSCSVSERDALQRTLLPIENWLFISHWKCTVCSNWKYKENVEKHDDVIKWNYFPRYCLLVRGTYRSPVNSPHKDQWCGALMFSLTCAWINGWVNTREAGDLRRHHAHYGIIVMSLTGMPGVRFVKWIDIVLAPPYI